jgi:hypothetical protein
MQDVGNSRGKEIQLIIPTEDTSFQSMVEKQAMLLAGSCCIKTTGTT